MNWRGVGRQPASPASSLALMAASRACAERDLLGQRQRQLAHVLLVFVERDVVALELIATALERADDGVDDALRRLELHEVALQWRAHARDHAQRAVEPARLEVERGGVQLLHLDAQIGQRLGDRPALFGLAEPGRARVPAACGCGWRRGAAGRDPCPRPRRWLVTRASWSSGSKVMSLSATASGPLLQLVADRWLDHDDLCLGALRRRAPGAGRARAPRWSCRSGSVILALPLCSGGSSSGRCRRDISGGGVLGWPGRPAP